MRIFIYECVSAGGLGFDVPPSLLREGRAMLAAVVADFSSLPDVEVVTIDDETVPGAFAAASSSCDWSLVIAPEFDDLLESRSQAVLDAGGRLLGSAPAAIHLTADKLALADFWRERRVPHPATRILGPSNCLTFPGRWVMKPRFGAGSQTTFLIRNRDDELRAWGSACQEGAGDFTEFIVQPHLPGQPASVALLIGKVQTIALAPARQHLSNDGRFRYEGGSLPLPAPLAERATRLALQAAAGIDGLLGYVGVDLILGQDDDYAIEINPRLTTSYLGLRQLCKQNLAKLMLGCIAAKKNPLPEWHPHEVRFSIASTEGIL